MEVFAQPPFNAGSITWQEQPGQWTLTVVCKATFVLAPGMSPLADAQEALNETDNHWDDDLARSLYAPSDLAPKKPRPEVLLVGSAYAPRGEEARSLRVRLVVGTVDKAIEVVVPRTVMRDGTIREGAPWKRMPLRYERAAGGADTWNPVGMGIESVDRHGRVSLPNLQQPGLAGAGLHEAIEPVGFGPIASSWSLRRDRLGGRAADPSGGRWDGEILGAGFDAEYFQTAPLDQGIDELHADEAIVLENLHPEHPDLVTRLPGVRPVVRVEAADLPAWELSLVADTLWIDTDRSICTMTWRGQIPLQERHPAGVIRVGVEEPGQPVRWPRATPDASFDRRANTESDPVDEGSPDLSHTAVDDHLLAMLAPRPPGEVLPFRGSPAPSPPRPAPRHRSSEQEDRVDTARMAAKSAPAAMPSWLSSTPPGAPVVVPPAPPAYVGVLEASNAAAGAPREAVSTTAAAARREPPASPPLPPRPLQELIWYDPEMVARLRERADWSTWMGPPPTSAPPDDIPARQAHARAERAGIAAVLARGIGIVDIEAAVTDAMTEDGAFEPPLSVAVGEIEALFDEAETLKLLIAAASPLAPGDKRLKEVLDQAGEVMKTPLGESPEMALGLGTRLREAWSKASRILPADYLDHHTRRILLDQRLYQKRKLGGAAWIRAHFTPAGASVPVPAYLPEAMGPHLPLFARFTARLIVEAIPQQDQHESSPVALRVLALARVLSPRSRQKSSAS
ncbi:MAG: DUF2169 domain-containing protein [Byssovorax sp.]